MYNKTPVEEFIYAEKALDLAVVAGFWRILNSIYNAIMEDVCEVIYVVAWNPETVIILPETEQVKLTPGVVKLFAQGTILA